MSFLIHYLTCSILFHKSLYEAQWDHYSILNQGGSLESSDHGSWSLMETNFNTNTMKQATLVGLREIMTLVVKF